MLPQQVLEALAELPEKGVLLDATVGGGGHSSLLLDAHPGWQLIGLDQAPAARAAAPNPPRPPAGPPPPPPPARPPPRP